MDDGKAIKAFIARHGIKLCRVAAYLGMSEELLRYHIKRGLNSGNLRDQFRKYVITRAESMLDDLDSIPAKQDPAHTEIEAKSAA